MSLILDIYCCVQLSALLEATIGIAAYYFVGKHLDD